MPGKYKKKIPSEEEGRYRMTVLGILEESDVSLTIEQIKLHDFSLTYLTGQKMARILNYLVDMGLVRKGQDKSAKRMKYMAVAKMEEQGYDVKVPPAYHVPRPYKGIPWDIEDAMEEIKNGMEEVV